MTAADLLALLRKRHDVKQGWILVTEVRNATGYATTARYADALALQTWPARGVRLEGFEIKVSRSDLVRELRDEHKAESLARYCARWWLVVAEKGLVDGVALPEGWGVLAPRGSVLVRVVEAAPRETAPWTPEFVASLVRAAHEQRPAAAEIEATVTARVLQSTETVRRCEERARREADALRELVQGFDAAFLRAGGAGRLAYASREAAENLGAAAATSYRLGGNAARLARTYAEQLAREAEALRALAGRLEAQPAEVTP